MRDEMQMAMAWGLTYDEEEDVIYGKRGGYPFLVYTADFRDSFLFDISVSAISGACALEAVREQLMNSNTGSIKDIECTGTKMTIHIKEMPDIASAQSEIDNVLYKLETFLAENEFEACCERCKKIGETDFLQMGREYGHFCPQCIKKIDEKLDLEAESILLKKEKNIIKKAIILILLGSALGIMGAVFMSNYSMLVRVGFSALWICLTMLTVRGMVKDGRLR